MFVIRPSQLRKLVQPGLIEFTRQLHQFIEAEYPEEVLLEDPKQVRQRLMAIIAKAHRYGFVLEQQVTTFACFCMELGDDFDEQPEFEPITTILTNPSFDAQTRIDRAGEQVFS